MASMTSLTCAAESRRLVDDTRGNVGRNVDIDKIDNCSEVSLGLLSTFMIAIVIWFLALPFFDVAGFTWIKTWEREPGQISLAHYKENLFYDYPANQDGVPAGAYQIMDGNNDGYVVIDEYNDFMGSLTNAMKMNGTVAEYTFKGLDADQDHVLTRSEFENGLTNPWFYYKPPTTTLAYVAPATAPEAAPRPAGSGMVIEHHAVQPTQDGQISMQDLLSRMGDLGRGQEMTAFQVFDLDKDSFAAKGEFLEGLKMMPQPLAGAAAEYVFHKLDTNQDNVVESEEFFKAFQARAYISPAPAMVTTTPAPNPLKVEALQELDLTEEPITLQRFTQGLGTVTPEIAFETLDTDKDHEISEKEMIDGGKAFSPPLTEVEARYAQKGLDVTGDGRVVFPEMSDTLKFGNFFPTRQQAEAARVRSA